MNESPRHIWNDKETPDGCLLQAAFHGGFAIALIRSLEQHHANGIRPSFNPESTIDWIYTFSKCAFRWASAYRALVRAADRGYRDALIGSGSVVEGEASASPGRSEAQKSNSQSDDRLPR